MAHSGTAILAAALGVMGAATAALASDITVTQATYGGNCGAPEGNATRHIARKCNRREQCDYTIDYKIIGDPVYGCAKDYVVGYTCSNGSSRLARATPEAGFGKRVQLSCAATATPAPSTPDRAPYGEGMKVQDATYGGNCGAQRGNVTSHLARACNGRSECDYVIDYRVIGDPAYGCAKDYIANYICPNGAKRSESVAPEAGGRSTIRLRCGRKIGS